MTPVSLLCGVLLALALLLARSASFSAPVSRSRLGAVGRRRRPPAAVPEPGSSSSRGRNWWPFRRPPRPLTGPEVALLADQLTALARAGLPPERIWSAVVEHGPSPPIRTLARAVVTGRRRGLPAAAVLRSEASPPRTRTDGGGSGLIQLALALEISERTGAGLSQTLGRLAEALRAQERAAEELQGALAGPRATAAVLTFLPLAGLGLGALLGGRPWHALLATAPGRLCLLAGGLLWLAGRLWTKYLIHRAGRLP